MAQKDDAEELPAPSHGIDLAEEGAEWHLRLHVVSPTSDITGGPIIDTLLGLNHPLPSSQ